MYRHPKNVVCLGAALLTSGALSSAWAQEGSVPETPQPSAVSTVSSATPLERGFVLSGGMGVRVGWLAAGSSGASADTGLIAGLGIGVKFGRLMLNLSTEFTNVSVTQSTASTPTRTNGNSVFMIMPGVQVALLRSADLRVELLGAFRLGLGTTITVTEPTPTMTTDQTRINFVYEVGPGARYWLHRHIAVTVLSGFRGDYYYVSNADNSSAKIGSNGLFASLTSQVVF